MELTCYPHRAKRFKCIPNIYRDALSVGELVQEYLPTYNTLPCRKTRTRDTTLSLLLGLPLLFSWYLLYFPPRFNGRLGTLPYLAKCLTQDT